MEATQTQTGQSICLCHTAVDGMMPQVIAASDIFASIRFNILQTFNANNTQLSFHIPIIVMVFAVIGES